jgi:hypothetical protein
VYAAIADQLIINEFASVSNRNSLAIQLRPAVVNELRRHEVHYLTTIRQSMSTSTLLPPPSSAIASSSSDYLRVVQETNYLGDEIVLHALASLLHCPIQLFRITQNEHRRKRTTWRFDLPDDPGFQVFNGGFRLEVEPLLVAFSDTNGFASIRQSSQQLYHNQQ